MKLLLVLSSSEACKQIADYVKELGVEIIHYRNIIKAMDNIDEISPDGVVVSATDFPRHWKTFVSFVRIGRPVESCAVVLLYNSFFSDKERGKAKFLNVNCLISEENLNKRSLNQLSDALRPHVPAIEWINHLAIKPQNEKKLAIILTNPLTGTLIAGKIIKISKAGMVFMPEHPRLTRNLTLMAELPSCSLRAGNAILSPICRVIRNEESLTLEFAHIKAREKRILHKFLREENAC
ncbi:MAG: PilZ domain-containing protein [Spirochaetaceae bacterium]|jgi:hypothetical protein|nr:PilZ domain-containing protein [Spirochaetaceae bacterium]